MEDYFFPSHYAAIALNQAIDGYNEGDLAQSIVVDVMWGVDSINKTVVDYYNASDIGTAIWDNTFDPSPSENQ